MAEAGIDISRQFPKPWTDEFVLAADIVVTMGCGDACPLLPENVSLGCFAAATSLHRLDLRLRQRACHELSRSCGTQGDISPTASDSHTAARGDHQLFAPVRSCQAIDGRGVY